jgi:hypothetical protein
MELDELRQKWAEHDRKLETSIRLNRQLLRDNYTGRARRALWRLAALLGLGSISMLAIVVWLGAFIYANRGTPELAWSAAVLDALAIAALATVNFQIGLALQIDYNQPVAAIQKRLERLRKTRIRYIQGICLTSALSWFPMFVVVMKVFLGINVYRTFDTGWIRWNVLFGLAVILPGVWLLRKLRNWMGPRFVRELAGYNLNAASDFLAKIEEFEGE